MIGIRAQRAMLCYAVPQRKSQSNEHKNECSKRAWW